MVTGSTGVDTGGVSEWTSGVPALRITARHSSTQLFVVATHGRHPGVVAPSSSSAAPHTAPPRRPPCRLAAPLRVNVGFLSSASEDKFLISKMIVAGRSARLAWLIFFVSAALLGVSSGACADTPSDCGTCAVCTTAVRSGTSTQVYYWVQTDPNSETVGSGTCVQRFDPVGSSTVRTADMAGLCGKRVFVKCSGGTTSSVTQNCKVEAKSSASQLKISSSVTASLVSGLAFYLIFN